MGTRFIAALTLAALAACAGVGTRLELDRSEVTAEVLARTGSEPLRESETTVRALMAAPLGPEEAVRVALVLDPRVRERLATLGIASAERVRAGLLRNPVLNFDATAFPGGTELGLGLALPLLELATLEARRDVAGLELAAVRARTVRELVRLVHDVRRAWVEAQLDERGSAVLRERLDAEEAAARLARELHAAGNLTSQALTAVEEALVDARIASAEAAGRARESREELARRIGSPESAERLELAAGHDIEALLRPALDDPESAAVAASLDLRELRAHAGALARAAGSARWNALFDGSTLGVAVRREVGRRGAGPSLSLPVPLFDDGVAARVAAEQALDAALARYEQRALDVRSSARRLTARSANSAERARLAHAELQPLARRHVHEVLQQYNAMQVGVFDVLDVRRGELEAARATLHHLRDAWLARIDLEELLAGSLPGSPTATNRAAVAAMEDS
jgi:cobalt-zinc-cadmium efflux system outer membrane protein